jgi:metabolite-proton symporter
MPQSNSPEPKNSTVRVLFASLVGTTIEFFDFYIYATAAVIVLPKLFFPSTDPTSGVLASLATFAIAFFARPLGSALFGHFGDRIGRKATLVVALLTMGLSTVAIGILPTHAQIGVWAPILLALCRFGQGLGLGGEWGGAVLLAVENAPPNRRAIYGLFPQLGAPIGFILSGITFLVLTDTLSDAQFFRFGWRLPFLASSLLVFVGLYVRLNIGETPVFELARAQAGPTDLPMVALVRQHLRPLVTGTLMAIIAFVLFYLMTVFALAWGTLELGIPKSEFLELQLWSMLAFAVGIPAGAWLAEFGRRRTLLGVAFAIAVFGLVLGRLFQAGIAGTAIMLFTGASLMGLTYGPLGTALSELFPTRVRYTGSSIAFNLAGIFGASLAPYFATWLAGHFGLNYVGYYLSAAALLSFAGTWFSPETRHENL